MFCVFKSFVYSRFIYLISWHKMDLLVESNNCWNIFYAHQFDISLRYRVLQNVSSFRVFHYQLWVIIGLVTEAVLVREELLLILFKITTDVWFEMSCLIDVMLSAIRCCFMIQRHHPKRPSRAVNTQHCFQKNVHVVKMCLYYCHMAGMMCDTLQSSFVCV